MKLETLNKCDTTRYPKLCAFIRKLLDKGVPLSCIDKNDWECNLSPSVYVHAKGNLFKMKKYARCSERDLASALAFYNSDGKNYHAIAG